MYVRQQQIMPQIMRSQQVSAGACGAARHGGARWVQVRVYVYVPHVMVEPGGCRYVCMCMCRTSWWSQVGAGGCVPQILIHFLFSFSTWVQNVVR